MNGDKTASDMAVAITGAFDIADAKAAEGDLEAFVDSLGKMGFLENYKPTSEVAEGDFRSRTVDTLVSFFKDGDP